MLKPHHIGHIQNPRNRFGMANKLSIALTIFKEIDQLTTSQPNPIHVYSAQWNSRPGHPQKQHECGIGGLQQVRKIGASQLPPFVGNFLSRNLWSKAMEFLVTPRED
ncbi:UNVERIFIED_CONTAM: hypothetical protein K2H54_035065 [Gekko kuhli]